MTVPSEFGYARAADGAYIAYRTMGEGPIDVAWQFDWLSNVDTIPESDHFGAQFLSLASFSRVILHDRRATGLSSRNVPVPNLETRVSDLVAVLEAVDARRPILGGEREGGAPNALLAATDPERIRSLIWYEPTAARGRRTIRGVRDPSTSSASPRTSDSGARLRTGQRSSRPRPSPATTSTPATQTWSPG